MPTYDVLPFWPFLVSFFSSLGMHNLKITIMPDFTPTQWMLKAHASKGSSDWEIYAECVREAIARHGGFVLDNFVQNRDKIAYENLMQGHKDEATIAGRTWMWGSGEIDDRYIAFKDTETQ